MFKVTRIENENEEKPNHDLQTHLHHMVTSYCDGYYPSVIIIT